MLIFVWGCCFKKYENGELLIEGFTGNKILNSNTSFYGVDNLSNGDLDRAIYSFWRSLLSILVKLVTFSSNAHTKLVAYQLLESVLIRHLNLTLSYIMSVIWPVLFSLSLMISIYSFWWKLISPFLLACWCDSFAIALMQIHFPDQKLKIL